MVSSSGGTRAPITPRDDTAPEEMLRRAGGGTRPSISRRLVLVFAAATGLVVANNYYAQSLLATLAHDFNASSGAAGQIVTLTQLGYAVGLLFIVPLGDLLDRRRLILIVLGATVLGLAASALAPSLVWLAALALLVGLTSVAAQIFVPFAADLAPPLRRGRIVGTVMSGLLLGVLMARVFAGVVAQAAGTWRAVYALAALLMLALIGALAFELPRVPRQDGALRYGALLRSVAALAWRDRVLQLRSAYGALGFACFSVLWTTLAFLLAHPPYDYGEAVIGLFGLLGVAGALCASIAGRLADRGWALWSTGAFVLLTVLSFALLAIGGHSVLALELGIVALDLGVQGTHITNQSEIYRASAGARSRITTVYMVSYFVGGALGSATAAALYAARGWTAVCTLGAIYALAAVALWAGQLATRSRRRGHAADTVKHADISYRYLMIVHLAHEHGGREGRPL